MTSPILLTGGYAWGLTAAPVAALGLRQLATAGPTLRGVLGVIGSGAALVALGMGVVLERRRSPLAPLVGIWGFLAALVLSWLSTPVLLDITRMDTTRGLLGAGGFALYALAWGVPDVLRRLVPEDDPRADTSAPLEARARLPWTARWVTALGVITAIVLTALAWRLRDISRSLLGQALAALLAVLVVSASAEIAVGRRGTELPPAPTRLRRASSVLLLLGLMLALGGALRWFIP
ncbi:MAG: hypothetical protein RMJ98_12320 [Myxococcales bacterium]|nr:hypothetical protein [Polyangiaceae bacterium]MDW8250073.1 hypothetical protein [Myxococcales bacterium]